MNKKTVPERIKLGRRKNSTNGEFNVMQRKIKESTLADFQKWVDDWVDEMEKANIKDNTKRVWEGVRALSGKVDTKPPINLTGKKDDTTIDSPEALADEWYKFLAAKFAATTAEQGRPAWPELPPRDPNNVITEKEFTDAKEKQSSRSRQNSS